MKSNFSKFNRDNSGDNNSGAKREESVKNQHNTHQISERGSSGSNNTSLGKREMTGPENSNLEMENGVEFKRREKIATNNNKSFVKEQSRAEDDTKASDEFLRDAEGKKEYFFRRFDEVVIQRCNQNEYLKDSYSKRLGEIREKLRSTSDSHKVFYDTVMDLKQEMDFREPQDKEDLLHQSIVFTRFMELIDKRLPKQDDSSSKQPESSKRKQEKYAPPEDFSTDKAQRG